VGRREYEPKAQIDKIDARDSEDNIAGDHDTPTDDTIDEIYQGDLVIGPLLCGIAHVIASVVTASASPVKLYAGQRPLTSTN
jgi:hypothetical protein